MEEQRVTFKTAKLAKKKGFNEPSKFIFDFVGKEYPEQTTLFWNTKPHINGSELISRPTQSLLQKWLREIHNIEIAVQWFDNGYIKAVNKKPFKANTYRIEGFNTYEQALEIGLQEALNLI